MRLWMLTWGPSISFIQGYDLEIMSCAFSSSAYNTLLAYCPCSNSIVQNDKLTLHDGNGGSMLPRISQKK